MVLLFDRDIETGIETTVIVQDDIIHVYNPTPELQAEIALTPIPENIVVHATPSLKRNIHDYIDIDLSVYKHGAWIDADDAQILRIKKRVVIDNIAPIKTFLGLSQDIERQKLSLFDKGIIILNDSIFDFTLEQKYEYFSIDITDPDLYFPLIIPPDIVITNIVDDIDETIDIIIEDIPIFDPFGDFWSDFSDDLKDFGKKAGVVLAIVGAVGIVGLIGYQYSKSYVAEKGAKKARD